MTLTWSVKDGGKLCTCGCLKCSHEDGVGMCIECDMAEPPRKCSEFKDRAEVLDAELSRLES